MLPAIVKEREAMKNHTASLMLKECIEAPQKVASQLKRNETALAELAARFAARPPSMIVTCARGSSDHASVYIKYLAQIMLGIPVLSFAPSIGSLYQKSINLSDALFICVSQSGKSPDLLRNAEIAKKSGAYVVAFVNVEDAPLCDIADVVIPLCADAELSVAATKSYIATLSAFAQMVAIWSGDKTLQQGLEKMPEQLQASLDLNWGNAVKALIQQNNLMVLARGVGFGVALETALKFKETSVLHAEGFSIAEVMHGPMALVTQGFPMMAYVQDDATKTTSLAAIEKLRAMGAHIYVAQTGNVTAEFAKYHLPMVNDIHPMLQPIAMIQAFYPMANELAFARGYNPDTPDHLKKVTETM